MGKKKLSFEQALQRLNEIIEELEKNQLPLDEMLAVYSEGVEHLAFCRQQLSVAEARFDELSEKKEVK